MSLRSSGGLSQSLWQRTLLGQFLISKRPQRVPVSGSLACLVLRNTCLAAGEQIRGVNTVTFERLLACITKVASSVIQGVLFPNTQIFLAAPSSKAVKAGFGAGCLKMCLVWCVCAEALTTAVFCMALSFVASGGRTCGCRVWVADDSSME